MKNLFRSCFIVFFALSGACFASSRPSGDAAGPAPGKPEADMSVNTGDAPYRLKRGWNEFGFLAGYSPKAITVLGGLYESEAEDRQFFLAAFRYGRTLAANSSLALQYVAHVVPLAAATGVIVDRAGEEGIAVYQRDTAYGIGVMPVGLQLDFMNGSKVHPFLYVNGGISKFNRPMPTERSGEVAFIGESGGGVRVFTSDRRALTFGLALHHISNAGLQSTNRGMNQFVFYAGFSFFR
jgi:hypothetical protein